MRQQLPYERATRFLDSAAVNSEVTARNYAVTLKDFDAYLQTRHLDLEKVIYTIKKGKNSVYEILQGYVPHLHKKGARNSTIRVKLAGVKSYLQFYDIDIVPIKFKNQVRPPKKDTEDGDPLDIDDVRALLNVCTNRRLKTLLFVLASGGMRITEALAIRIMDINIDQMPTRVHIRREFTKTRKPRDIFISNEATRFLRQWLGWKYSQERANPLERKGEDLIFRANQETTKDLGNIYRSVLNEWHRALKAANLAKMKEGVHRYTITIHSLRGFVKTVLSDQISSDYSEWFLGHSKSTYWQKKPEERASLYLEKCMPHLTFQDMTEIRTHAKSMEKTIDDLQRQLREKDKKMKQIALDAARQVYSEQKGLKGEFGKPTLS